MVFSRLIHSNQLIGEVSEMLLML